MQALKKARSVEGELLLDAVLVGVALLIARAPSFELASLLWETP